MIASALTARLRSDNGCLPFSCSGRAPAHQSTAAPDAACIARARGALAPGPHHSRSHQASPGYHQRVRPLDVRLPLQAFGLGGVAGHPKGAVGRQCLVEQLGGLLLVSSATTVEQHPGSQAA